MINVEKVDILEIVEKYVDLIPHYNGASVYYTGRCPFHGEDNHPSFAVYTNTQRAFCWTCCPEGMDVIGFVRKLNGCSFEEAVQIATIGLSDTEILSKKLSGVYDNPDIDLRLLALRLYSLYRKMDIEEAIDISYDVHQYIQAEKFMLANKILCKYGV